MTDERPGDERRPLQEQVDGLEERIEQLEEIDATRMAREHLDSRFKAMDERMTRLEVGMTLVMDLKEQVKRLGDWGQRWQYEIEKETRASSRFRDEAIHLMKDQDRKIDRLLSSKWGRR